MITILTETGNHHIDATAEEVTTDRSLKITRDGKTIADFRRWTAWYETPDTKDEPTNA